MAVVDVLRAVLVLANYARVILLFYLVENFRDFCTQHAKNRLCLAGDLAHIAFIFELCHQFLLLLVMLCAYCRPDYHVWLPWSRFTVHYLAPERHETAASFHSWRYTSLRFLCLFAPWRFIEFIVHSRHIREQPMWSNPLFAGSALLPDTLFLMFSVQWVTGSSSSPFISRTQLHRCWLATLHHLLFTSRPRSYQL